ncbi:ABC transporter ATP-binding protein [Marinibaculum pumilum]|uniref:ABC transporter ATP-binding protein n=1 Tax=Marinibaculum pumilum TaxID=1766165 RepID=A0ABV7KY41_9PROT
MNAGDDIPLLEVADLTVTLRTPRGPAAAVRGLDFTLRRGEKLGIVGESGCGKSMTALALMGLLPDGARIDGRIALEGLDLARAPEAALCRIRGNRIGMIFQEPMTSLNPLHRIGRQVAEPLRLHRGMDARAARARAVELLDRVGIPDARRRADAYPHELSGGQRQRVMIALALACDPAVLIADEPTTALDVTIQGQILDLIEDLVAERGMALVLISHDLGVIGEVVDKVMVMYGGMAVERGPVDAVFDRLTHPYAQGLFAALPQLGRALAGTDRLQTIPGRVPELADMPAGCPFTPRCPIAEDRCATVPPPVVALDGGAVTAGSGHEAVCHRVPKALEGVFGRPPVGSDGDLDRRAVTAGEGPT